MTGILNVATNSLLVYQRMLATIGHNISNANNASYSKQNTILSTQEPQRLGPFYIGSGVTIDSIIRSFDMAATHGLRSATSNFYDADVMQTYMNAIDNLLGNDTVGLNKSMNSFFSSLNMASANPTDISARNQFLNDATLLTKDFNRISASLDQIKDDVKQEMKLVSYQINDLTKQIADINKVLLNNTNPSPDLLDKRDALILELSKKANIHVVDRGDGMINVSLGQSQSLILGSEFIPLTTSTNYSDPSKLDISINIKDKTMPISDTITGGRLAGLIYVQDKLIDEMKSQLGVIALSISDAINHQHKEGMDLDGNLGINFFNDINDVSLSKMRSISSTGNLGNAELSVDIENINQLSGSDYYIQANSPTNFTVTNLKSKQVTNHTAFPVNLDGLSIQLTSGSMSAGDSFTIKPSVSASAHIAMNISNARQLAFASPIRSQASPNNNGTGQLNYEGITDIDSNLFTLVPGQLSPPLKIVFLSPSSYQLVNTNDSSVIEGPISYSASTNHVVFPTPGTYDPGIRFNLTGVPNAGDEFSILYNQNGIIDNRNALKMMEVQSKKLLNQGTTSLMDQSATLIADVGTKTNQANTVKDMNEILLHQYEEKRSSAVGVNLEEEGARLLEVQQAYKAAAEVINVGINLFDIILNTVQHR